MYFHSLSIPIVDKNILSSSSSLTYIFKKSFLPTFESPINIKLNDPDWFSKFAGLRFNSETILIGNSFLVSFIAIFILFINSWILFPFLIDNFWLSNNLLLSKNSFNSKLLTFLSSSKSILFSTRIALM